jgi:hypothetical protein
MARSRRGNFAEARALIIDENGCRARILALQLAPLQFAHCRFERLLLTPRFRQRLVALVADERAALAAAAGRLRLGKERRNSVRFFGRDLRYDAQNRLALRHRVSPPCPKKFLHAPIHLSLPPVRLPFAPAPAAWQARSPIWRLPDFVAIANCQLVNGQTGQLVNGQWSMVKLVYGLWSMVYGL